jgi:hypothetical protein
MPRAGQSGPSPVRAGRSRENGTRSGILAVLLPLRASHDERKGTCRRRFPWRSTHSGCAALADLPRNKTDEELRQLAERGGVFGCI